MPAWHRQRRAGPRVGNL